MTFGGAWLVALAVIALVGIGAGVVNLALLLAGDVT